MGENRNSYSKTDRDATFMHMKEDHMRNGQLKRVAKRNLMSEKGLEMRGKRAEYSEGIFGQIKWNMAFKRFLLGGLDKIDLEWGLLCFALNIKKMNKKDIGKIKEEAMAKAILLSKNIIKS